MMDFNKICSIALEFSGWNYIDLISKVTDGYSFGFADENGETVLINPLYVSDDGSEIYYYHPVDSYKQMIYEIVVPNDFRYDKY